MEKNHDLAKWLAGEMTENELQAFEQSTGYDDYARIKLYASQLEAPAFDTAAFYKNISESKQRARKVKPLYQSWAYRIAAIIVVLLGVAYFVVSGANTAKSAGNGQQCTFMLPDDSEVVLNAGSEIEYKTWNWSNNRNLQLQGEAYFKVSKGKTFEVCTDLGKVTVLGTQFNVKARGDRFDVTCFEGSVKVNYEKQELILTKGQSVAFANGIKIEIPENNINVPLWMSSELAFTNERLPNIVMELERQYSVSIELKGIDENQLFTGTLPMKNLENCLQILGTVYHLQPVKINKDKIVLEAVDGQN